MALVALTNWAAGLLNGYKYKENGLPNSIKYSTLGVTTFGGMIRVLGNFDSPNITRLTAGQKLGGLFIAVPIVMGTQFCMGHHIGKAIRWSEDEPRSNKNGIKFQLL
jgi:hypothetical protein